MAAINDAEMGMSDQILSLPRLPAPALATGQPQIEVVDEKHSHPNPSVVVEKPAPAPKPKSKASRWIRFQLWFNTYRRFFTIVTILNLVGIIMAALDRFDYAKNHLGAIVLGNLLTAVLMRNELFIRSLYTVFIYAFRGVSLPPDSLEDSKADNIASGLLCASN